MSEKEFTALQLMAFEAEKKNSKGMRFYIDQLINQPDAAYKFAVEIRKAFVNELDPGKFPETAGRWPLLRKAFRKELGLPAKGLGDLGTASTGSAVAGAIGSVAQIAGSIILMKYQADLARKAERKAEAREREEREEAKRILQRQADAASYQAALAQRMGTAPVSVGQQQQIQQQFAEENTVKVMTNMARDEVQYQNAMDQQIQQREGTSPVVYAAPAAAAVALVALK